MTVRPAVAADLGIIWAKDEPRPQSIKAIVGVVDGEIVAIAGLGFRRGVVEMICNLKPEARRYKLRIHKEAVRFVAEACQRHRLIYATADPREPGASRWLTRLGFKHQEGTLYSLWQN